ncbi:hypothetical protein ACFWZ7_24875 [Nocardiopsis alba]|uniref:hypothetical protein n=1 Tax=Nocardiopsis alba TaxID=53437 RepID=UPI003672FB7F
MSLTTIRVSRRPRRCQRDCGVPIRAGQQAEHTAIPPHGHDVLDSDQWIHLVSHTGPCPDREMMPAEELTAARAEFNTWFARRLAEVHDDIVDLTARTAAL